MHIWALQQTVLHILGRQSGMILQNQEHQTKQNQKVPNVTETQIYERLVPNCCAAILNLV